MGFISRNGLAFLEMRWPPSPECLLAAFFELKRFWILSGFILSIVSQHSSVLGKCVVTLIASWWRSSCLDSYSVPGVPLCFQGQDEVSCKTGCNRIRLLGFFIACYVPNFRDSKNHFFENTPSRKYPLFPHPGYGCLCSCSSFFLID